MIGSAPPLSRLAVPLLTLLLLAPGARAGTVAPESEAAAQGSLGLRVTLGRACTVDVLVVPGPSVSSDQVACRTLHAGELEVTSPGATFSAGREIILHDDFSVAIGIPFTAAIDPLVDSAFAWVGDDSPAAESLYNALFDLRIEGVAWAAGDEIGHLNGYSADGALVFRVALRWNEAVGETRLALFARDEAAGGLREHSTDFLLGPGFSTIQISWRSGAGDGELVASINGAPFAGLVDLANDASRVDHIRWGAVDGTLTGTTGWIDLDDFLSWR